MLRLATSDPNNDEPRRRYSPAEEAVRLAREQVNSRETTEAQAFKRLFLDEEYQLYIILAKDKVSETIKARTLDELRKSEQGMQLLEKTLLKCEEIEKHVADIYNYVNPDDFLTMNSDEKELPDLRNFKYALASAVTRTALEKKLNVNLACSASLPKPDAAPEPVISPPSTPDIMPPAIAKNTSSLFSCRDLIPVITIGYAALATVVIAKFY